MTSIRFDPPLPDHVAFVALSPGDGIGFDLHPDEEALLSARTLESRRADFRLGREAARRALAELGFVGTPVLRGDMREPVWPVGVVGSITHAAGHALAAVAWRRRCGGIGLDLEHRDRGFPELADSVAFGEEVDLLESVPEPERSWMALELFSAKETIYKAFFPRVGRYFGFEAARVVPASDPDHVTARFVAELDPAYPPDRSFLLGRRWYGDLVLTWLVLDSVG